MARNIAVGIDIGTYQIKVMVTEFGKKSADAPRVIATGFSESKGLRHGYIVNIPEVVRSIKAAVRQAEKIAGTPIKHVFLSVGGIGLTGVTAQASVMVSRADQEITDLDVTKVLEICENDLPNSVSLNRKIIHAVPIGYKIDGKHVLGRPQGMKGLKLEIKTLFITCLEQHLNDIIQAVGEAGIEVEDVMASPIAASLVTLTKAQKIAGCVLANIGAETVSVVVFENNIPISLEVFPIGSTDITHDIALGLKLPLEDAEKLKLGQTIDNAYPRKKLEEIILARLSDIFELIDAHLKKIGRSELLPAGIIITGGGSSLTSIEDIAKSSLKLPSKTAEVLTEGNSRFQLRDSSWAVAYGLCILGFNQDNEYPGGIISGNRTRRFGGWAKEQMNRIVDWTKQFLP